MAAARRALPVATVVPKSPRKRLSSADRERQILESAIHFFTEQGLEGKTRELAKQIGITHPLLYHYFPSKRDLIERVYQAVYVERWKEEWEHQLDDRTVPLPERLTRFYVDYAETILTKEWVRILLFSAMSDGYIPENYMRLLSERLFPRIVRETRAHLGVSKRGAGSEAERELIWGLHGGIFYIGIRRWLYHLPVPKNLSATVGNRVRSYLLAAPEIFGAAAAS